MIDPEELAYLREAYSETPPPCPVCNSERTRTSFKDPLGDTTVWECNKVLRERGPDWPAHYAKSLTATYASAPAAIVRLLLHAYDAVIDEITQHPPAK